MSRTILILTPYYKPYIGGAEKWARMLVRGLSDNWRVVVLTARHNRSLSPIERDGKAMIHRLGLGFRWDRFLFPMLALIKSYRLEFDLSYAVMASYAGAAALLIKIFRRRFYILNLQSGTLGTPEYTNIIRWFWPFYKKIHTEATFIHAISELLAKRAEGLGVSREKIFVIPTGVDLSKFSVAKENKRRIITAARLEKVKGVEYLIRAAPLILNAIPEAEFFIAGDGSERNRLERLAIDLKVADRIKFLGFIKNNQIPEFLNDGGVFVCPSLAEGLGVSILEAMACGLAVVGTRTGAIPEIIKDGENGLLAQPADSNDLAGKIINLLEDENKRKKLTTNGLKFIKDYDWEKIRVKLDSLLNKM